jgi:carbamate kinase
VADASGTLRGVEAVVDKDLTAALLACAVNADALLLLTDVDAVIDGFGTPEARPISHATPTELRARSFPAGSMGPKVEAACRFAEATGKMAAICRLGAAAALLRREAGTIISP